MAEEAMGSTGTKTDALVRQIIEQIIDGRFDANQRIPSERQLASDYSVNRATIHNVLASLCARGWVYRKPGVGTFVRPAEQRTLGSRPVFVQVHLTGGRTSPGLRAQQYEVMRGIEAACRRGGARLLFESGRQSVPIDSLVPASLEAGVIVMPANREEHDRCAAGMSSERPTVWIGPPPAEVGKLHRSVQIDVRMATQRAVQHFREQGHEHIALAVTDDHLLCKPLIDAFHEVLDDLAVHPIIWRERTLCDLGRRVSSQLVYGGRRSVTAVFCCDDYVAAQVAQSAAAVGKSAPFAISIIGLGDLASRFGDTGMPPDFLSSITYDEALMGELAAAALLDKDAPPVQTVPVDLVRRRSVAPPQPTA